MFQTTIQREVSTEGIGLHTGVFGHVRLVPAPADTGKDDSGSCACKVAGAPTQGPSGYLALAALGVALTGLRRRRRPRQASRRAGKPLSYAVSNPLE